MSNYKYYTPVELFDALLELLPITHPRNIIDISCGSFNLLKAAKKRFPESDCVGVDIEDQTNLEDNITFIKDDGRVYAQKINKQKKGFDLILSNPPFGSLRKEERLFEEEPDCVLNSRYECEMMYANYLLSHYNSWLIIILPSTFIEGDKYMSYRASLMKHFKLYAIIKLPHNTFSRGDISSYAIILNRTRKKIHLNTVYGNAELCNNSWTVILNKKINSCQINDGIWQHFEQINSNYKKIKIQDIYRGSISSAYFSTKGNDILHCSSKFQEKQWVPSVHCCRNVSVSFCKYARTGDIIVNRIGKHAGYWVQYEGEDILISDCLIVIKSNKNIKDYLSSHSINGRLLIPIKGVATKYVSMKDLIDYYFILPKT